VTSEWSEVLATAQLTILLTGIVGLGLAGFCFLFPSKVLGLMRSRWAAGESRYVDAGRTRPGTAGDPPSAGKVVLTGVGALLIGVAALVVAFTVAAGK
jgi:hypothetical protein